MDSTKKLQWVNGRKNWVRCAVDVVVNGQQREKHFDLATNWDWAINTQTLSTIVIPTPHWCSHSVRWYSGSAGWAGSRLRCTMLLAVTLTGNTVRWPCWSVCEDNSAFVIILGNRIVSRSLGISVSDREQRAGRPRPKISADRFTLLVWSMRDSAIHLVWA